MQRTERMIPTRIIDKHIWGQPARQLRADVTVDPEHEVKYTGKALVISERVTITTGYEHGYRSAHRDEATRLLGGKLVCISRLIYRPVRNAPLQVTTTWARHSDYYKEV